MTRLSSFFQIVRDRPKQLLGVGFGGLGGSHFALWVRGSREFSTALAAGDVAAALTPVVSYVQHHPAYALAVLGGVALAAWEK